MPNMPPNSKAELETQLSTELTELQNMSRLRCLADTRLRPAGQLLRQNQSFLDASSNDYLGLAASPILPHEIWPLLHKNQLTEAWPTLEEALRLQGSGGSRHITGNHPIYGVLESLIAQLKQKPAALVFGSGYQANVGILTALLGPQDAVFSDALNHASIIDGVRLSGASKYIYHHCDMQHLQKLLQDSTARRKLIVSDALFSMDGTLAPVSELSALATEYGAWLMIDEAHTGGVYGPQGAGYVAQLGVHKGVDLLMGTLSKSYGSLGAYVASSQLMIDYLTNKARSLIFTTALPPATLAHSLLNILRSQEMDQARQDLQQDAANLRAVWQKAGLDIAASQSQVVPIVLGSDAQTTAIAKQLKSAGILAVPIRPPTVEKNRARIRFTLTTAQSRAERGWLADVVLSVLAG